MLRKAILEQFPDTGTFDRYIEVFGGAGWILFSRNTHAKMEVYNDVNGNLVNLFRVVKYHPDTLQKELDWLLMSREQFFDAVQEARGLTDIQRAARFWIAIKESFGTDCQSFSVRPRKMQPAIEFLREASDRLQTVVIENADFERIIKTYDRPNALFYLDPPYYDAEKYYADRFQKEDHERLKNKLMEIQGKFLLSYNDCPQIRELYDGYTVTKVERNNSLVTKGKVRKYQELIIRNY